MTNDEIQKFVGRLEDAVDFRSARSHVEELAISDYLRIRANRDACFSFAAAFLREAIASSERSDLTPTNCQTFEGHEQVMCGFSSKQVFDTRLFSRWDDLESTLREARRADAIRDGVSLIGCALVICIVLIPAAGLIAWLLEQV